MKRKVAIVVIPFGIAERGVEVFTKNLAENLKYDFEFTVLSKAKTTPFTKKIACIDRNNKLVNWIYNLNPGLKKKLDLFFLNPTEFEALTFSFCSFFHFLFNKYDLILPISGIWGAIVCNIIRFLKGTPFICISEGGIEPIALRQNPDKYIATNLAIFKWVKKYFPEVHSILIPNGVNLKQFKDALPQKNLKLEKPIFLSVAGFEVQKRIDFAIRAVSTLRKGSLLVIGKNGKEKNLLKNLGGKLLGKKRFSIKSSAHKDIAGYYKSASVFTLPSENEPFGNVYLEAMAAGLPVVAPDDEARKYILGKAGVYFKENDLKDYVKKLMKAASFKYPYSKSLKQVQKYSWEKVGKKYGQVFKNVCKE